MFSLDQDPEHDRTFADVAARLEEWHRLQERRVSPIERAWTRAGFTLAFGDGLARHHVYIVGDRAIALLPGWAATSAAVYRVAILERIAREWEAAGRWDLLTPLGHALGAIAREEYDLGHGPAA